MAGRGLLHQVDLPGPLVGPLEGRIVENGQHFIDQAFYVIPGAGGQGPGSRHNKGHGQGQEENPQPITSRTSWLDICLFLSLPGNRAGRLSVTEPSGASGGTLPGLAPDLRGEDLETHATINIK